MNCRGNCCQGEIAIKKIKVYKEIAEIECETEHRMLQYNTILNYMVCTVCVF